MRWAVAATQPAKRYSPHNHTISVYGVVDSWERYLDSVKAARTAPEQKVRLAEAVRILRRALGEDWPSKSKDSYHTILLSLRSISGAASDSLLVYWADCVSALEGAEGFVGMVDKLRRPAGIAGSIAELEVAGRLAARGCTVELEPEAGRKKPDMRCRYGDLEFLVEVKTLETAAESRKAIRTVAGILAACSSVHFAGVIFKALSEPHLEEVAGVVAREAGRAVLCKQAVEVHLDRVLKMYLVPNDMPDGTAMRAEWYRRQEDAGVVPRGSCGLYGPSSNVREEHRIRGRINQFSRERQVPQEHLGILVLAGRFFFWSVDDAESFVDKIIEAVYELENIQAVVLVSDKAIADKRETEIVDRADFVYIRNCIYDYGVEEVVIVKNRFCKSGLDYRRLASLLVYAG